MTTDLSGRAIGRALKVSRTAVAKYLEWSRGSGLTWEQGQELPDSELVRPSRAGTNARYERLAERFPMMVKELRRSAGRVRSALRSRPWSARCWTSVSTRSRASRWPWASSTCTASMVRSACSGLVVGRWSVTSITDLTRFPLWNFGLIGVAVAWFLGIGTIAVVQFGEHSGYRLDNTSEVGLQFVARALDGDSGTRRMYGTDDNPRDRHRRARSAFTSRPKQEMAEQREVAVPAKWRR